MTLVDRREAHHERRAPSHLVRLHVAPQARLDFGPVRSDRPKDVGGRVAAVVGPARRGIAHREGRRLAAQHDAMDGAEEAQRHRVVERPVEASVAEQIGRESPGDHVRPEPAEADVRMVDDSELGGLVGRVSLGTLDPPPARREVEPATWLLATVAVLLAGEMLLAHRFLMPRRGR